MLCVGCDICLQVCPRSAIFRLASDDNVGAALTDASQQYADPTKKMDFLLAGVGGQGVLTASDIVCEVGLAIGFDAKKSEVHGFSQRGGVVDSHVRWGETVYAPLAEKGAVDVLLAFETAGGGALDQLPAAGRAGHRQRAEAHADVGDDRRRRLSRRRGDRGRAAPGHAIVCRWWTGWPRLRSWATRAWPTRCLLGALSAHMEIDPAVWLSVIERRVPRKYVEMNRLAFWAGRGTGPITAHRRDARERQGRRDERTATTCLLPFSALSAFSAKLTPHFGCLCGGSSTVKLLTLPCRRSSRSRHRCRAANEPPGSSNVPAAPC